MRNKISLNDYMSTVGKKLTEAKARLVVPGVRDAGSGFMFTADRITKSLRNLYFSMSDSVFDPTESLFQAFSERPGLNDVQNVYGVDVTDISITATLASMLPYLAAERSMDKPQDVMFYQSLVASQDSGGFTTGQDVVNPFAPLSNAIDLGQSGSMLTATITSVAQTHTETVSLGKAIAKKSVVLTFTLGGNVVAYGRDKDGDGIIYLTAGGAVTSCSVDYAGVLTLTTIAANVTVTVAAYAERTSDSTGSTTLKTKPKTSTKLIISEPKRIILESSFEDQAYINKMTYDLQSAGVSMDYGQRAMKQLLDSYIHYIDLTVFRQIYVTAMKNTHYATRFDLTSYSLGTSEASVKNDMLNSFMLDLNNQLMKSCGRGPTVYYTDMEGARILANNPMFFTPNANYDLYINGMIGTYRNIPVLRHNYLDGKAGAGVAFIGAAHKTADGNAAPVVYGEYLPPYSIRPAINYDNPSQFSQALFSQSVTDEIVPELATYGTIKYASAG